MKPLAKVCGLLPDSWYDTVFMAPYNQLYKLGLGNKLNSSSLDEAALALGPRLD